MNIYLDLNIFDQLEKLEKLDSTVNANYHILQSLIKAGKVSTAYSNAHLNDLFRGFIKNPNFIDGHLKNIGGLTNNLCICQYWGKQKVDWHYRDIFEFFNQKATEWEYEFQSYPDLFEEQPILKLAAELYKFQQLPTEFKQGYKEPMFGVMFPSAKIHNTTYSLQEDIFNFQNRLKSDYSLYRSFKQYLLTSLSKLKKNSEFIKSIRANFKDLPKHLELVDLFDAYTPLNKTSENALYSKIIDVFFKYDLSGYKTDGHFNNMFDDGLHCFYGAHFDFFITNDDRCKYKSEKTYERLNIRTKVITIEQIDRLQNCL